MKKLLISLLVIAVAAVAAMLVVSYISEGASKDVDAALNSYYDATGTTFKFNFGEWGK